MKVVIVCKRLPMIKTAILTRSFNGRKRPMFWFKRLCGQRSIAKIGVIEHRLPPELDQLRLILMNIKVINF